MVLKQKQIKLGDKPLFFSAVEVVQKHEAYMEIKKLLKQKGIRFQTPHLASTRVHWAKGSRKQMREAQWRTGYKERHHGNASENQEHKGS